MVLEEDHPAVVPAEAVEDLGKIPIVVPRNQMFGEHVNNHQVEFAKEYYDKNGLIIPVFNIDDIADTIVCYDKIVNTMSNKIINNNKNFNEKLNEIADDLMNNK